MSDLHPRIKEKLARQLPAGGELVSAVGTANKTSTLSVRMGNNVREFNMPKIDIWTRYPARVNLLVHSTATVNDVFAALSERDGLYLVKDTDYGSDDTPVSWDYTGRGSIRLRVLPTSVLYYGVLDIDVVNKDATIESVTKPVVLPLKYERVALALVSKVYYAPKRKIFKGNNLTDDFCKAVIDHLTSLNLELFGDVLDAMKQGEVLSSHHDGISDIMTFRLPNGLTYLVRYAGDTCFLPAV